MAIIASRPAAFCAFLWTSAVLSTFLMTAPFASASDVIETSNRAPISTYCDDSAPSLKHQSQPRHRLECMLNDAKHYQQKGSSTRQHYWAYKAQAWINYAIHKDSMNSRSPIAMQAIQEANSILQALKSGTEDELDLTPNIPATSALMRPDLWATLNALKDSGGINTAPRELAFSEVALIWAAADQCIQGDRQSGLHFRMTDRWLEQVREAYINAHDDTANIALENLINTYYQQYAPLDATEDTCHGLVWPSH